MGWTWGDSTQTVTASDTAAGGRGADGAAATPPPATGLGVLCFFSTALLHTSPYLSFHKVSYNILYRVLYSFVCRPIDLLWQEGLDRIQTASLEWTKYSSNAAFSRTKKKKKMLLMSDDRPLSVETAFLNHTVSLTMHHIILSRCDPQCCEGIM